MPKYNVPIWVVVEAESQELAWEKVEGLESLKLLREDTDLDPDSEPTVDEPQEIEDA